MKKIIFSRIALIVMFFSSISMPLYSRWQDWVPEGFYNYMPNVSEYMPSSPSWVTSFTNILPEDNKWKLFLGLATALGLRYIVYPYYKAFQEGKEDQETREQAAVSYSFKDNSTDFTLATNAENMIRFLKIVSNDFSGIRGNVQQTESVKPERLFKVFIYAVLENMTKDTISKFTTDQQHRDFWNNKIEKIKDLNTNPEMLLGGLNDFYLNTLKNSLEVYIKNNDSAVAQQILQSLNRALS